jgi:KR domain/Phosphopantetheine attachment site/Beta-ketoacyl synthase-like, N-terminal
LRAEGRAVATVASGDSFAAEGDAFTIDPGRRQDYDALLAALRSAGRLPRRILHLWGITAGEPADGEALTAGLVSLMLLGQALAAAGALPLRLLVVADGLADVADGDVVHPAKAALLGAVKVMGQELTGLACTAVDVAAIPADGFGAGRLIDQILGEADAPPRAEEMAVAFRGRRRWARSFAPVRLAAPSRPPLAADGVYLITDGTHGPGMAIAEHLVRAVGARVALVMPPQLPPRERWESWEGLPEAPPGQDVIGAALGRLLALEAEGLLDRILLLRSAPTDAAGLRAAFAEARSGCGRVRGVFHTAGAFTGGLLLLKTPEALLAAIDPAVRGARALMAAVEAEPELPDFILLSSSTLAVAGGLGQLDHAAAGCFLEGLALRRAGDGEVSTVMMTVHWDPYQWGGWLAATAGAAAGLSPQEISANHETFGVPAGTSGDALERLLAAGLPAFVVSNRDVGTLLRETDALAAEVLAGETGNAPREAHPRPGLATPYTPPRDELEEELAALWQDLFGIAPVGVEDSFLELGGHSLLAIQMATRLRAAFAVDLPVTVLFEAPTIAQLALQIRRARGEEDPAELEALLALVEGLSPEEAAEELAAIAAVSASGS